MFWRRDFRENDKSGYHVFGEDPNIPVLKKVTIYVFNKGNERYISYIEYNHYIFQIAVEILKK